MLFRSALILLAVFLSSTLATEQFEQGDIKASHMQHKRDATYGARSEKTHLHLYQRGAGDSEDKPITEYIPPRNNTKRIFFNTKRHRGRTFVRFLLAKSVNYPESDSVPIVISTPDCLTYGLLNDTSNLSKYNEKPLRTKALLEDADVARNCQSYFARSAAPQGFSPHQDDTNIGWPVAISISNDTTSMIGWNVSSAIHEGKIKWTSEVDVDLPDHQLWLVCKGWWHQHENHWHGPQYYGRNCLLKVTADVAGKPKEKCIAANAAATNKELREGSPLQTKTCDDEDENQVWHTQSVAGERPNYYENGQSLNDTATPLDYFKCKQFGACVP